MDRERPNLVQARKHRRTQGDLPRTQGKSASVEGGVDLEERGNGLRNPRSVSEPPIRLPCSGRRGQRGDLIVKSE